MDEDRVALHVEEGIARVRLIRPSAGTAIDRAMVAAMDEAVGELEIAAVLAPRESYG